MTVTINGTSGITTPEVTLDNTSADGGQVVLKSSGYDNWNLDNYSGSLRAYYNATEYMRMDSSGNLGIGTSSPSTKLHVSGSANPTMIVNRSVSTGDAGISLQSTGTSVAKLTGLYGGGLIFHTGSSDTERMRIDSSGNVGIGTSSPTGFSGYRTIQTDATTGGLFDIKVNGTRTANFQADASSALIETKTAIPLIFGTSATERMRIASDGTVTVGGYNVLGIGVGQTWQSVSRSSGTTYTNSTGKPIQIMVCTDNTGNTTYGSAGAAKFYINGNNVGQQFCSNAANIGGMFQAVIPDGSTYSVSASTIRTWYELR